MHALIAFLCVLSLTCSISFGSECNGNTQKTTTKTAFENSKMNSCTECKAYFRMYCDKFWVYENKIEHLSKECWKFVRGTIKHNRNDDWNRFRKVFAKNWDRRNSQPWNEFIQIKFGHFKVNVVLGDLEPRIHSSVHATQHTTTKSNHGYQPHQVIVVVCVHIFIFFLNFFLYK